MDLTISEPGTADRSVMKVLGEAWPILSGLAVVLVWVGVLWSRVETHAEQIHEQKEASKDVLKVVNETARDVAAIRAILEERQKK